ncbi:MULTISPECIES: hypothetical protein [Catenuloplanes]|uniref:Uncharacterized protein n=1 Tax=Catenuloplanes niger TaxID=587534 RepID=A0AAE4CTF0_9ACTN|nr:hypothetical protein [Catenuloplanes niger]MDR7323352.1 hypothetical protein [Catenuloplanes niger]
MRPRQNPFRRYNIRVFDATFQVLRNRNIEMTLNLDHPRIEGRLDRILATYTQTAIDAGEPMREPRIELWDVENGRKARDWDGA